MKNAEDNYKEEEAKQKAIFNTAISAILLLIIKIKNN